MKKKFFCWLRLRQVNTMPSPRRIKYIEPFHWIIENDKSRWLPAVDPTQRETILSIGAFLQNLEYASGNLGYTC